jgi:MYXO-CTERM domain-containing protein
MLQRSLARRRGSLAALVPPALFIVLAQTATCGGAPVDPVVRLGLEFPEQATVVLRAGRGFTRAANRAFAAAPAHAGPRQRGGLAEPVWMELPADGAGAFVFRGANGFEAHVREVGAAGAGRIVERAVAYRREDGASFWTTAPGGTEEWLQIEPGRAFANRPVATWQVTGAKLHARGGAVELAGADGVARVRVTAPAAFAAGGRRVEARLRVGAQIEETSTIELYADAGGEAVLVDPLWMAATSLLAPRADHAAALLGDSTVLASGGTDGNTVSLDTAEVYDPVADAWTDVGPMGSAHVCHTATALLDGTVLVAGGVDADSDIEAVAESYGTSSGWTGTQNMNWSRMNHTATRLSDGRVLVVGGKGQHQAQPALAHLAKGGGFSGTVPLLPHGDHPEGGSGPTTFNSICWSFPDAGSGGPGTTNTAEIFDPALGGWVPAANLFQNHERHTATALPDGTVLVTGGQDGGSIQADTEIYDPVADMWSEPNTPLITPREDHVAALLPDGSVLVAGGTDGDSPAIAAAEIFSGGAWQPAMSMGTPRVHATATVLPDGTVLVAGGSDGTSSLATAEIFDPATQMWAPASPMMNARSEHTATTLAGGDVLVAGGIDSSQNAGVTAEIYVPVLPNGSPCTVQTQCISGFCAQGVCCSAACTGAPCEACTKALGATKDGTCTAVNDNMVCSSGECMTSGKCEKGACSGATPTACTPVDACHEPGICDPTSGMCPEGVARLDGSPCPNGVCIASVCVLDPTIGASSSSSSGGSGTASSAASGSGSTAGAGGSGGGEVDSTALLSGSGCSTGGAPAGGAPAGLLLALLALWRRRSPR